MTRTPTDMETAMAHGEPGWCPKCNGLMNNHAIGCEWAPNPPATEDQMKCYAALSALGDPVVVAEALPELVEAGAELADKAQILRINCGGYRPERPTEKRLFLEDMKALLDAEDQWSDALAKLKARP